MAELSDQLLVVTVLGYLGAMLGYLVEYAFGRRGAVARAAARRPERPGAPRELVGAATAGRIAVASTTAPADQAAPAGRGPAAWAGRVAVALTGLTAAAHAGVLLTRGLAAARVPWGNMYEFVVTLSLVSALTWLGLLLRRADLRQLGLFVTTALVLVLGFAGVVLHTEVAPLVPALNSYWLKIHVSAAAVSSGLLLVAFVPAALYLLRERYEGGRRTFPASLTARLPRADVLERLAFRLHAFAFPIWTFAVIAGAIWAEAAWGRYWGWDPKETWSFISWVAYAAYLHARATPSVRGRTAAWFAVAAWTTMMINLYVINFVAVGLHSYADG